MPHLHTLETAAGNPTHRARSYVLFCVSGGDVRCDAVKCSTVAAWWGVGAVAVMTLLGGCGSNVASTDAAGPSHDDSAIATGLDGPVMHHVGAYANEGEDAEVRGVVEIEGDCLYVALDEVGERYPVVWPASTSWDPDTGRVKSLGYGNGPDVAQQIH